MNPKYADTELKTNSNLQKVLDHCFRSSNAVSINFVRAGASAYCISTPRLFSVCPAEN